jgi:hypothetical protein
MKLNIWHIVPLNDLRDHEESVDCWCQPELLDDDYADCVYLHPAMDGREAFESGERKMS